MKQLEIYEDTFYDAWKPLSEGENSPLRERFWKMPRARRSWLIRSTNRPNPGEIRFTPHFVYFTGQAG